MQKGTRIQTNDNSFIKQFTQRCIGHGHGHSPVEGGQVVRDPAFYPKRFCQRVVQIWKGDDAKTPKGSYRNLRKPVLQKKHSTYVPAAIHATLARSQPVPRAAQKHSMR